MRCSGSANSSSRNTSTPTRRPWSSTTQPYVTSASDESGDEVTQDIAGTTDLFDAGRAHTIKLTFHDVNYQDMLDTYFAEGEKEYVEARAVAALVAGRAVPGHAELGVSPTAWMRGLAEAASELRRHLLDRLREGRVDRAEALLASMDDVYSALVVVDYPDALTSGLRRTLDALRAVLERSRGDVTTTVLQTRLQRAIERHQPG